MKGLVRFLALFFVICLLTFALVIVLAGKGVWW